MTVVTTDEFQVEIDDVSGAVYVCLRPKDNRPKSIVKVTKVVHAEGAQVNLDYSLNKLYGIEILV